MAGAAERGGSPWRGAGSASLRTPPLVLPPRLVLGLPSAPRTALGLGAADRDPLAGAQFVGNFETVLVDDRLRSDAEALGDAVDRVLVARNIDRDRVRSGAGAGILHGAFTIAVEEPIDLRASAERAGQSRRG